MLLVPAYSNITHNLGDKHRELNYKICKAIDPTLITIVLSELVKEGMEPNLSKIFEAQANALLAALRSENNRLKLNYTKPPNRN